MKKIVYIALLILVVGGAAFFIYSYNHSKKSATPQYGILNPNPIENNQSTGAPRGDDGKVLGETNIPANTAPQQAASAPAPKPAPKPVPAPKAAPAPKPVPAPAAGGLATYRISELSFEISVPSTWQPRLETAAGNVLAFYTADGQVGQIEVIPNAQESFDALTAEVSANPNVSSVQQTTAAGQRALIFNDARYGGRVIAFVFNNNVYYLRGANAQQPELGRLKLF